MAVVRCKRTEYVTSLLEISAESGALLAPRGYLNYEREAAARRRSVRGRGQCG